MRPPNDSEPSPVDPVVADQGVAASGVADPITRPLLHCPTCASTQLDPVVEAGENEVHYLCRACGRCWNVALGSVERVSPHTCMGCPERGRCEDVWAIDHQEAQRPPTARA